MSNIKVYFAGLEKCLENENQNKCIDKVFVNAKLGIIRREMCRFNC